MAIRYTIRMFQGEVGTHRPVSSVEPPHRSLLEALGNLAALADQHRLEEEDSTLGEGLTKGRLGEALVGLARYANMRGWNLQDIARAALPDPGAEPPDA